MERRTYTTSEAADIAGLTLRVCDKWVSLGVVAPSASEAQPGSGNRRYWSENDLRVLTVLRRLRQVRATEDALTLAAKTLARADVKTGDARWIVATRKVALVVKLADLPTVVSDGAWVVRLG